MNSLPLLKCYSGIATTKNRVVAVVNNRNEHRIILLQDLVYLEGYGNYSYLYTSDGKRYLISKTLKKFADLLDKSHFVRIHKSSIINLLYLQQYSQCTQSVQMKDGKEIPVSRRRIRDISHVTNKT